MTKGHHHPEQTEYMCNFQNNGETLFHVTVNYLVRNGQVKQSFMKHLWLVLSLCVC